MYNKMKILYFWLLLVLPVAIRGDKDNDTIPCSDQCSCSKMPNDDHAFIVNCSDISAIPKDLPQGTVELWFSHNSFSQFDLSSLYHLTNLKKLMLDHCDISTFTSYSDLCRKLEILDLSHNKLNQIPTGLPSSLKTLQLSHNEIEVLNYAESLFNLQNLKELFVDHNLISAVRITAFHDASESTLLTSLQKLALNSNKISFIVSHAFDGLESLSAMTMADNKLIHLEREIFTGLKNLRHFDVSRNKLSHMDDDTFQDLKQLKYLNFNSNKLIAFPKNIPMVEWLDLSYNSIRSITENSRPDIYPIEVLNLAHNPFHCDCYMRWLKDLYDRREYLVKHIDLDPKDFIPSCKSPLALSGKTWNKIKDDSFKCDTLDDDSEINLPGQESDIELSTRVGVVTDKTIQITWFSSNPNFAMGNVLIQYYVFGHRTGSMKHVEVAAAQQEYHVKHLKPSTNYVLCVRPRQVAGDHQAGAPPPPLSLKDCIEVATKEPKPPALVSRLEVFWYYVLGMLATFIGIFTAIGGFAMIYGLWNSKTDWSSKYMAEETYLDETTYATDEPITKENKPHAD